MATFCKFVTVAALLLHSLFGCGLHHATGCDGHQHASQHRTPPADRAGSCCHDHDRDEAGFARQQCEAESRPLACGGRVRPSAQPSSCEGDAPAGGDHDGCHSEIECSFLPSPQVVFASTATPLPALLADANSRGSRYATALRRTGQPLERFSCHGSLARCAFLCTWRI